MHFSFFCVYKLQYGKSFFFLFFDDFLLYSVFMYGFW